METSLSDVVGLIEGQGRDWQAHKTSTDATLSTLRRDFDTHFLKSNRPGAYALNSGEAEPVRMLQTADGRKLPWLTKSQQFADHCQDKTDEDFSLAQYCRDAIVGSRKAQSGPALVPLMVGRQVIDSVRAKTVLVQAGATSIVVDGPTNLARLTQDPTVYVHTEAATDISESDVVAEPVALNPKVLAVLIPLTVELVQDSPNLDTLLNLALAQAFAAKVDALGLALLLADVDIPESATGQDPATWSATLAAVGAALALNQALPTAHISAPADFIARASQLASTAGSWLGRPPALGGMAELQTTSMAAGTALFGDFAAGFALAARSDLRIEIVRHARATSGSHLLVAHMRIGGVVLQPGKLFRQLKTVI